MFSFRINTIGIILAVLLTIGWIVAVSLILQSCAPPPRFDNGDKTVLGPKSWGEVVEPDMPGYEERKKE